HFFISVRTGCTELLAEAAELCEVIVWTASRAEYANPIIHFLDEGRCITHRLYQQQCLKNATGAPKDISKLGRDVQRLVVVDDDPATYALNPDNAIPVTSWWGILQTKNSRLERIFFERCVESWTSPSS
ncbi:HAD-like protein, partial [Gonapodya prolifera JEL478]